MYPSPLSTHGLPRPRRQLPILIVLLAVVAVCSIPIVIFNKVCFSLRPIPSPASINVIASNGVALLPQTTGLTAYRMQDGSKLWSVSNNIVAESSTTNALVADNQSAYELMSHSIAPSVQFTVLARNLQTRTMLWQRMAQVQPPEYHVLLQSIGDVLVVANFGTSGTLSGLDIRTGQLLWQAQVAYSGNPGTIANDGKNVFIWNQNGLETLRATDGKQLWQTSPAIATLGSLYPAPAQQAIGVFSGTAIAFFNAASGHLLWQAATDYGMIPVMTTSTLYVRQNGYLVALRLSDGQRLWQDGAAGQASVIATTQNSVLVQISTNASNGFTVNGNGNPTYSLEVLRASDGQSLNQMMLASSTTLSDYLSGLNADFADQNNFYVELNSSKGSNLAAIDGATGQMLWHTTLTNNGGEKLQTIDQGIITATYTVTNTDTCPHSSTLDVGAVRLSDGKVLWHGTLATFQ